MALTVPSFDEFVAFWGDEAPTSIDEDRADLLLSLSADLLWLATGLDDDPVDSRLALLVKYAICDMAIFIFLHRDDIDAEYSPFQSERIGSYSYSKSYSKLTRTVSSNEPTGVPLFDRVVAEILDDLAYGSGTIVAGKKVFREDYVPLAYEAGFTPIYQDPSAWPTTYGGWHGNADNDAGVWY